MSAARRPRIWITRAQPGADRTAARLRTEGLEPVVRPVLEIVHLCPSLPELGVYSALAFTSANGVAAFSALTESRDNPVMAIGDVTAKAALKAGFADVMSANGDLAALGALIARRGEGPILAPSAETPAGDLGTAVREAGGSVHVDALPIYRAVPTRSTSPQAFDGVLIHSARAARLVSLGNARTLQTAVIICISDAAALPFPKEGFDVHVARKPNEQAVLDELAKAFGGWNR